MFYIQVGRSRLVRALRKQTGLTQEQFPAKLGLTFSAINRRGTPKSNLQSWQWRNLKSFG